MNILVMANMAASLPDPGGLSVRAPGRFMATPDKQK
jgi:hypothetical protein